MQGAPDAEWSECSDDELVERLNQGAADEALVVLHQRYGPAIERFARGIVRDEHQTQDVVIETFERVFLKSHLYQIGSNFRAWLFEIARNQAFTALRQRRRTPRPLSSIACEDDEADPLQGIEDWRDARDAETRELLEALDQAVTQLPPKYRDAFELCERRALSYAAAARLLDIPVGTVAIRLMRARRQLYLSLAGHFDRLRRPPACFQ